MARATTLERLAPYAEAGAARLAKQPVSDGKPDRLPGRNADWGVIFAHLEARLGMLRTWRYSWWAYWAELARFILPRRYKWLITANTMDRGFPINNEIIDGKPTQAMEICAAGLLSGLMSPSRPWFTLGIGIPNFDPDSAAKAWLEDTQERLYIVLSQSNFYQIFAQAFQDVTVFGTAVVIIYEDFEDAIRCYAPCLGEFYLATGALLSVDTMYREFTYTVSQIVDWFTLDRCPDMIRRHWQQGGASLELEFVVCHAIEPNFDLSDRGHGKVQVVPGSFTYREVYWLKGQKTERELAKAGYHERPHVVARWSQVSNDAYGRSPGMDALGDVKQLQQETRRKAEFLEKGVRPPMGANAELKNQPASIMPGQITYTDTAGGKKGFWPLMEVQPTWLGPLTQDIEKIEGRIDEFFFVDVFQAITRMEGVQPRNELEISKREGERVQRLGPVIEDFETEVAGPAIQRVMNILERRRLLKPRPPSMRGLPIQIKYNSLLKIAQRAAETASIEQMFKMAEPVTAAAQVAGKPNPLRQLDLDKTFRAYGERTGFPENLWLSADQVAREDTIKAKNAQQQQAVAGGMAAVQAAKNLGDADVGGGETALGLMLGGRRSGPPAGQA